MHKDNAGKVCRNNLEDHRFTSRPVGANVNGVTKIKFGLLVIKNFWLLEERTGLHLKPNQLTSPYIHFASRKPCD